ncbi:hypothetical protein BV898_05716 [Hypsibius exemplaris]|uniref:Uncharacterized protein n=1 Tax=Hypsibius exemplaris TaxID=2072580 RepID=A0A1W0WY83_HYPEX|nr:hypothetical protein BV898_05716 [Hypsibius exemplaris]
MSITSRTLFALIMWYCLITHPILGSSFPPPAHAGDDDETNDHRTFSHLNTHEILSLNSRQFYFCPGDSDEFHFICRNKSPDIRACMVNRCYVDGSSVITEVHQNNGGTGVVLKEHGHFELAVHVRDEDSANAWYFCAPACTLKELPRTTRNMETKTCRPCPTAPRSAGTSLQGKVNGTFKSIATAHHDSLSPPKDGAMPQHIKLNVMFEGSTLSCLLLIAAFGVAAGVCYFQRRNEKLFPDSAGAYFI